jgi:phosphoketolase
MSAVPQGNPPTIPAFCDGIDYFGTPWPEMDRLGQSPVIASNDRALTATDDAHGIYQTALAADALRYLTLQVTAAKASGHPGGFASSAEAHAALMMLGYKDLITEVGHHAPGFYSALFLDRSLEAMGIETVRQLRERFRERGGLLGHLSGAIPGVLSPAGPLGQGQHFALAAALLNRDRLFPFTLGDGGMGEPYPLSAINHFHTAFPEVTNFLPVLVWNGFSQEHHAMVSRWDNARMAAFWRGYGFQEVVLVDARDFAPETTEDAPYVDSTRFPLEQRLAFTEAVLAGVDRAARAALAGYRSVFIIKQLKGAGVHTYGAKSHNLHPGDTVEAEPIAAALQARALPPEAWTCVRTNLSRAGGGPASEVAVTETERPLPPVELSLSARPVGEKHVPSTAMGELVVQTGQADPDFIVSNADGNEASGLKRINEGLKVRHPSRDPLYNQDPAGQVYEPLSEDACAGLAAAMSLMGGRALWLSYESFAINGWPIVQTVTQAMAELRRSTPSIVTLFTAGALEQGRNGWTHQRPEIEGYLAAMMRNGNVYPIYPVDANMIQAAYAWGSATRNKGVALIASKSPLPVRVELEAAGQAVEHGAWELAAPGAGDGPRVVLAAAGDMIFLPLFEARERLEAKGYRVRIVAVVNPRRLYRPQDVAWSEAAEPDERFMNDADFATLFDGDVLVAATGGASAVLEPVLLRSRAPQRELFAWQRGETTASAAELMTYNGLTAERLVDTVERCTAG